MAVVCRIARWLLSIAMLFAVSAAVAQTNSAAPSASGGGKFRTACDQDLERFCVGVQPGGGRLVQCLSTHTGALSAACETIIAGRGGGQFRAACDQDLQRFCTGVKGRGGRLVQCLMSHTSELSVACRNRIAAIQVRRGTSNPGAQSPASQPAAPVTVSNSPAKIGSFLRASCGPDVQRLCAGVRRESEVLSCLDSQRLQLSTTCALYFQNFGARSITQKNVPNKKPPPPATPPVPAQESDSSKQPPPPPATQPIPAQENAKQLPSLPPTKPVPFPD